MFVQFDLTVMTYGYEIQELNAIIVHWRNEDKQEMKYIVEEYMHDKGSGYVQTLKCQSLKNHTTKNGQNQCWNDSRKNVEDYR